MKIIEKPTDLLSKLQAFPVFEGIEPAALQWLIDKSDYYHFSVGESIFNPGDSADHMIVAVAGRVEGRFVQNGRSRVFGIYGPGEITGALPFSRIKQVKGTGYVLIDAYLLYLHRSHFTEMVSVSYELTQALVAEMTNRVRDYSRMYFLDEKLMALGKLSAGLAHELNNPAAAMVRSGESLYRKIHSTPERFKATMQLKATPEETDGVNEILFGKIDQMGTAQELSLIELEERKDDLLDYLEELIDDPAKAEEITDTLVDFNFTIDDLDKLKAIMGTDRLGTILWWIESTLDLERLVTEIQESAKRISELVSSVKSYSHMDEEPTKTQVDVHKGLHSTITMLKHKFKKKQIRLVKEKADNLPTIEAIGGELNQVWTNLIVNAIDAVEPGGLLTIRTSYEHGCVCVEIEDNGPGIPEDVQSRIFEPFFTTKGVGEGTGLGLDIVRRIVLKHDADITVESRPGRTVFRVCFPLKMRESVETGDSLVDAN